MLLALVPIRPGPAVGLSIGLVRVRGVVFERGIVLEVGRGRV